MDYELATDRLAERMQHLCRHWEQKRRIAAQQSTLSPQPHALAIALSREAGTQGTCVAREVGTRLGWAVYDHELLEQIAQDLGVSTNLLKSVDERRESWLQEVFQTFLQIPHVSESAYVQHLIKIILALGSHGDCVIVGRGAAFILPAATTLRVRLMAPWRYRTAAMSEQLGLPETEASREVKAIDHERDSFVESHFSKSPADPRNYDLILDFRRFGVTGCAQLVVDATHCLQVGGSTGNGLGRDPKPGAQTIGMGSQANDLGP
jgi:cytidylate kinase